MTVENSETILTGERITRETERFELHSLQKRGELVRIGANVRRVVDVDRIWFILAPLEGVERHIGVA